MRLKGINPIEQHVEKLVLGVVGVVFLGVLAMQFLVAPNDVEYEGQQVAPSEVLDRLGAKASGVLTQMRNPEPALPSVETPDLADRFESAFGEPVLESERVASVPFGSRFELEIAEVENLDGPVSPLRLPEPTAALAASQWSTVDPFFARAHPSLDEYIHASQQPLDEATVTVETVIDGTVIESALRASAEGRRAIPSHWWTDGAEGLIEVLGVELERQRFQPDGGWSEAEVVERVRWTPTVMEAFSGGTPEGETPSWETLRPSDLRELARMAQDDPSLVSQPPYLATIAGPVWVPPSKIPERERRAELESKIERVENEIAQLDEDIVQIKDRQAGRKQSSSSRSASSGRGGGRSSGGGGFVLGGGGSSSSSSSSRRDTDPFEKQIERKETQIQDLEQELTDLFDELEETEDVTGTGATTRTAARRPRGATGAGRDPNLPMQPIILGGGSGRRSSDPSSRSTGRTRRASGVESPGPLLEVEDYQVWAHDLTAEPGETYRYRIRYGVNNPLFGREKSLGTEEASLVALSKEPLVMSPWSPWSEAVPVGDTEYYFVTSARDRGQLGQGAASATVEVYQMFYGNYRRHTVTAEPGMAVEASFTLPEDLPEFVDLRDTPAADLNAYFDEREMGEDATRSPLRAQGSDVDDEDERPWLSFFPERRESAVNMVLLDVAAYPLTEPGAIEETGGRTLYEVFFLDPKQGVIARRPDQDRGMAVYEVVERSARLGETAEIRRPDPEPEP